MPIGRIMRNLESGLLIERERERETDCIREREREPHNNNKKVIYFCFTIFIINFNNKFVVFIAFKSS